MAYRTSRKVALVIGNSDYTRSDNKLIHCTKNATDLSDLLQKIDFDINEIHTNVKRDDEMNIIFRRFANTIEDNDIILFYFSGHGYHIDNVNYLLPIDDKYIKNENDTADFGVNAEHALELLLKKKKSYAMIFILDCSTSYSFKDKSKSGGMIKGINVDSSLGPSVQLICSDNERRSFNNIFSRHLLDNLATENVTIIDIFKHIEELVSRESERKLCPLIINRLQQHQEIYLNEILNCTREFFIQKYFHLLF